MDDQYWKEADQRTEELLAKYPWPVRWIARLVYAREDRRIKAIGVKREAELAAMTPEERRKNTGLEAMYRRRDAGKKKTPP